MTFGSDAETVAGKLAKIYDNGNVDLIKTILDDMLEVTTRWNYEPTSDYAIYVRTIWAYAAIQIRGAERGDSEAIHRLPLWRYVFERLEGV